MKRTASLLLAGLLSSGLVVASDNERPDHFEGQSSDTLEQAIENLTEGNQQLAELLSQDEITDTQMGEIHMLTYTLENALQKVDEEVDAMAVLLEEVHLGSETLDQERVASNGERYLEASSLLTE
ncbi:DUF6746 family protein [Halomonas sp. TD01]|uniref:DUF6746 family protein n=1 Tax=Halomonas sp. TD01 TaxID=999141 RepID=UPI000214D61E|nr:DUF6746 family protein [Halomonas sp. TD01]EGP18668.1 hypothetical protein GME_15805 [Halomonas sp. TD01]CAH1044683.1 hypothetical protein HPTD01_3161 [Halomonas sp. TD01]